MDEQKRLFAIRLNKLIEKSGKTQTEIARDLGINKTTLSSWKRGVAFPTSGKLQMLDDYFGVGKSYFVEEKPSFDYMLRINGRENILVEVEKMNDATYSHLLEYARFLNKREG
jgi:transcriptional regulator with XRE-family HTH domain